MQVSYPKDNPKHNSLQIHKLEGTDFREFYVDKGYRCVFKIEGNVYKLYIDFEIFTMKLIYKEMKSLKKIAEKIYGNKS